jgi:aquaporin Z
VHYAATVPGPAGEMVALLAEATIAFGLMTIILFVTNTPKLVRLTGVFAGCLIALYITVEAPLSGMSMNPARTLASALPGTLFDALWIYFVGPIAGMLLAVDACRLIRRTPEVICAKLNHHTIAAAFSTAATPRLGLPASHTRTTEALGENPCPANATT